MSISILSIGTALPINKLSQDKIINRIIPSLDVDESLKKWLSRLSKLSNIDYRYSVVKDFIELLPSVKSFGRTDMLTRMKMYEEQAPMLAYEAAKKAIDKSGCDVSDITHVVSVSCTGFLAPGIELILVNKLGLNPDVKRLGVNFMGCMAGINALDVARAYAAEDSKNKILVVCTELNTLHYHNAEKTKESLLGLILFGDGAASAIVGQSTTATLKFKEKISYIVKNTEESMTWKSGNIAYIMRLLNHVPSCISSEICKLFHNDDKTAWAIHPGGTSIIRGIQQSLNLSSSQVELSNYVLRMYGNMSSATILFILEKLMEKKEHRERLVNAIAFGPGLAIEGIVFEWN